MQWEDAYDTAGDIFIIRYLFTLMLVLIFHVSLIQNLTRGNMQKMSDDLELNIEDFAFKREKPLNLL